MATLFITGTDTGVGKTYISCGLLQALMKQRPDLRIDVMKPVETGCELQDGVLVPADGKRLLEAYGAAVPVEQIVSYRFRSPVAPLVASEVEGRPIDWGSLIKDIRARAALVDLLIIEGAGGLLVPITAEKTYLDLATECDAESLVVVNSKLGALNHSALTFAVLRTAGLPVLGYVLNQAESTDSSDSKFPVTAFESNQASLRAIGEQYGIEELASVPHGQAADSCWEEQLVQQVVTRLNKYFKRTQDLSVGAHREQRA